MHGEIGLPLAATVARDAAGIGTEPLVTLLVQAHGEHIFICEAAVAGKGVAYISGNKVYLMHPDGGPHPQSVLLGLYGEGAYIDIFATSKVSITCGKVSPVDFVFAASALPEQMRINAKSRAEIEVCINSRQIK